METMELQTKDVEENSAQMCAIASTFEVTSQEELDSAGELLVDIKKIRKQIDETFDPHIKAAHAAHKNLVATKAKFNAPLEAAEGVLKARTGKYLQEQEAARQAEQRRLEAEARQQEQARRDAEAAAIRAQAEAQAKEAATKADAKAILAEAKQETAAIAAAPMIVTAPVAPPAPVAPKGVTKSTVWKFRIVDEKAIPHEYLLIDEAKIGKIVRAMRGETRIAGVEVYPETQVGVRTR